MAAGGSAAVLTLAFEGDFRGLPTLAVRVPAGSHEGVGALLSNAVVVAAAPGLTLSRTSLALHENPGATNANRGTYTLLPDTPPTGCAAGVGVAVSSDNADVAANPALLTFTTSTWNTAQTVTATAGPDDDGVDDAATLSHGIATACDGAGYVAALAIAGVDVAVDDAQDAGGGAGRGPVHQRRGRRPAGARRGPRHGRGADVLRAARHGADADHDGDARQRRRGSGPPSTAAPSRSTRPTGTPRRRSPRGRPTTTTPRTNPRRSSRPRPPPRRASTRARRRA